MLLGSAGVNQADLSKRSPATVFATACFLPTLG